MKMMRVRDQAPHHPQVHLLQGQIMIVVLKDHHLLIHHLKGVAVNLMRKKKKLTWLNLEGEEELYQI